MQRAGRQGQTMLEYGVLLTVLVAALLTMQIYMKRGFSGRLRQAADSIGEAYAPRRTTSDLLFNAKNKTQTTSTLEFRDSDGDGKADQQVMVTSTKILSDGTSRTGSETVSSLGSEKLWE